MRNIAPTLAAALVTLAGLSVANSAQAREEGMWTFDNFPIARANAALGTHIDQAWLDRVRLSSVKYGGCSAGLVSGDGLVMTNNHCVDSCVARLSTQAVNYTETGFAPRNREGELECPGDWAEILLDISDVTARMQAVGGDLTGQAFVQARAAEADRIEAEACAEDRTLRCRVITLYRGGQYKLYTFKRYTDVRLAWAPENQAATFGGDPDNFSFPRFAVDAAFIRLYENGQPVHTPNHFRWNAQAPVAGEAVFLSGSPGATQRLLTMDQLMTIRDVVLPLDQLIASELRGRIIRYAEEGERQAFEAGEPLRSLENTYKRGRGRMAALIDPEFMRMKAEGEADFARRAGANPANPDTVWAQLAAIQPTARELYPAMALLEGGTGMGTTSAGGGSNLFAYARTLVRAAQEREKPSDERLPEYSDSNLRSVRSNLVSARPIYPGLEQVRMEWWLSKTREWLTADDPSVRTLLGRESPEALSARLIEGTTLADPEVRKALWDGGLAAIEASDDPLIQWMLAIQEPTRAIRARWEAEVQGPTDRLSEQLAALRFQAYGDSVYPDATGTLRLTYGRIEGSDVPGQRWGPFTTFNGLWDRSTGADPFNVAPQILAARNRIDGDTILNMTLSTDTIGGSSGSPVINEAMEILGANFDSTVLSQRNAYGYDRRTNRSVIVTTGAVTVALRDVYGMTHLLQELGAE